MQTSLSWSYSAYSSAVTCLRKFKYCYVDKIAPEGPESGDMAFGSALHCALNACLTGQNPDAIFEIYWNSYKEKEVEYGRYKWGDLAKLGSEFIRKFIKLHADNYKLEFAEKRLFGSYKGVLLEGTPDFYGSYQGRASLRDFKTSGRNYEQEREHNALQLYLYAYLYRSNFPGSRIDTLGYTVFNKQGSGSIQDLTWEFREQDMMKVLDDLVDYCSHMSGLEKYPRNLNACLDYNRKCPYWNKCHKEDKE